MNAQLARLSSAVDVESMQALIPAIGMWCSSASVPLLEQLLRDPDRTVVAEAARALERITGRSYASNIPERGKPIHLDHDWSLLSRVTERSRAIVKTTKGEFVLQLLPDDAPFTVLNFVRLSREGFYDGLLFHRVVPNFVIQGGDPRGDGWGGPGYTIRTEVTMRGYERGSVGIASAGKDTEGCQFFVTHSATPHLDGRYTIFARVVKGMDVVDAIQINDRILSIRITE
jgi:peptidylprolyl isomerase